MFSVEVGHAVGIPGGVAGNLVGIPTDVVCRRLEDVRLPR